MEPPIRRILAPNPGLWTHGGTNTWIIGRDSLVLIDPGPDLAPHAEAILAAIAGRPVEAVVVTHAHRDHCGLARRMGGALGAPILAAAHPLGRPLGDGEQPGPSVDLAFLPDQPLIDGKSLHFAELRLWPWATPGHLGGHFCLQLGDALFSGDHVMGWSTSTVSPPEGDMRAYRKSLALLAGRGWSRFYPGHGPEIADPEARLEALSSHRLAREEQILTALARGARDMGALVQALYPDLKPALQAAAEGNVLAHLIELENEGYVRRDPGMAWVSLLPHV